MEHNQNGDDAIGVLWKKNLTALVVVMTTRNLRSTKFNTQNQTPNSVDSHRREKKLKNGGVALIPTKNPAVVWYGQYCTFYQ